VLAGVPGSRLLLEIKGIDEQETFRQEVLERFVRNGISEERLELLPRKPEHQYALYNRLDIALDPYPCNGGTTTMDCLWMGVPLVVLEGRHFVSRMGVTLLRNVGLGELIGADEDEYVAKAVQLGTDLTLLKQTRHGLRERVQASPLMDAKRFAGQMGKAFQGMWEECCRQSQQAAPNARKRQPLAQKH